MGASANWSCMLFAIDCYIGWHWMPTNLPPNARSLAYQLFIDSMASVGYTQENHLLTVFFYDWRRPLSENAEKLKSKIAEVRALTGSKKVHLVGHSMGGLVARGYVQSADYNYDVDYLILVGSPNEGSAKAYTYWEGASLPGRPD